jgi:hypothetical protein
VCALRVNFLPIGTPSINGVGCWIDVREFEQADQCKRVFGKAFGDRAVLIAGTTDPCASRASGVDVERSCLDRGNSRLAHSHSGCYTTRRLWGQDYEMPGTRDENGHVFSALWRSAQASQLLPRPLAPVRSKLRRSAIQSQAASLRKARGRAHEGSDILNVRPMEEMDRGDRAHSNPEQGF